MGSSSSRPARSAVRKLPTRVPPSSTVTRPAPPKPSPSSVSPPPKDQPSDAPADFSARLNRLGVVDVSAVAHHPGPLYRSTAQNPTIAALDARRRVQQLVDDDFASRGKKSSSGRIFADISTIKRIIQLRERGSAPSEIEKSLRLQPGLASKLGRPGVLSSI